MQALYRSASLFFISPAKLVYNPRQKIISVEYYIKGHEKYRLRLGAKCCVSAVNNQLHFLRTGRRKCSVSAVNNQLHSLQTRRRKMLGLCYIFCSPSFTLTFLHAISEK